MTDKRLTLDWTKAHDVTPLEKSLSEAAPHLLAARTSLLEGTGKGSDYTGWVQMPKDQGAALLQEVKAQAQRLASFSDAVVVCGIGGSLLGAKAVSEALTHAFASALPASAQPRPQLFWAGHHMATDELVELLDALDEMQPAVICISKSGGTMETALSFRILRGYLEQRYGQAEAHARIVCVTDPQDGTLKAIAKEFQFPTLPIPKNVGGRYSVFTAVGLLPLAVAGVDIEALWDGAHTAARDAQNPQNASLETNPALCYAGVRNALYKEGYKVEALCHWTPKLRGVAEWWKQLFGESDGKDHTGLFPASVQFSTDLHSMGQYFQEGERMLFATHLKINDESSIKQGVLKRKITIPAAPWKDGFEFLVGSDLEKAQSNAQKGTILAHADGKLPSLVWEIPESNAWWMGYFLYTNLFACAVGGYARGVNPFDQPGVENYKLNMFALLGKSGHADRGEALRQRLQTGTRLRSLGVTSKT